MSKLVTIIGGGLAGCEAAWQIAKYGFQVVLYEMRTAEKKTPAHQTDSLAELVCSNSFRSDNALNSAVGVLHEELRIVDSLIMKVADKNKVPAGSALAVDREGFALEVQKHIIDHPNIQLKRQEIENLQGIEGDIIIIATGPLTSDKLSREIQAITATDYLNFFDAIAPVIYKDSIDFNKAWYQSRYDKQATENKLEVGDYINCPLNKQEYDNFISNLIEADKVEFKDWEKDTPYFNGCLPIEVMAERGEQTLRFGPMKPVGLTNPHSVDKAYAVVQLRQDNKSATLYNIVGFQTKLKHNEQKRIFKTIAGLENAEFARLGGIHRNSFIKSPELLRQTLSLKTDSRIKFAGQITGVEGYVESVACGLVAAIFSVFELKDREVSMPDKTTAIGSLINYITEGACGENFQPMNINFGLFPEIKKKMNKKDRKQAYCIRALESIKKWKEEISLLL